MKEILIEAKWDACGFMQQYTVERDVTPGKIKLTLIQKTFEPHKEICHIEYKNIGREYTSPLLSWYNALFCSAAYNAAPDYEYMHHAVQAGKKPSATVYLEPSSKEGRKLMENLPSTCGAAPYSGNIIFVYRKGCLSDFFDFDEIQSIYQDHGCYGVDWEKVKSYFSMPLEDFGYQEKCGFDLQSGGNTEQTIITGLVLGYPVESTISYQSYLWK